MTGFQGLPGLPGARGRIGSRGLPGLPGLDGRSGLKVMFLGSLPNFFRPLKQICYKKIYGTQK